MPVVDIHTHVYPPSYVSLLRSRSSVPLIQSTPGAGVRLVILPGELESTAPVKGRPIGTSYWDINEKINFMNLHDIDVSVISLANPWLDFLPAAEAGSAAKHINDEVNQICMHHKGRLFAFAALPLTAPAAEVEAEIQRLTTLTCIRGVIIGTTGLGKGLDDPALDAVYGALEKCDLPIFLHPHYGLPSEVYGGRASEYGHVLPLALGFPLETTIAVTRMFLSRVFDRFPKLQVILAHSGGTLPFLAGRIESCIAHDGRLFKEGKLSDNRRDLWDILKSNIYLDAVIYSHVGLKTAISASGEDRLMFGTDHPFFPPLGDETEWLSVTLNRDAVDKAFDNDVSRNKVLGGNASRVLKLQI